MISALGCSPQVEQVASLCQRELPKPVTLEFADRSMVFRSGSAFQNVLMFTSSTDTCAQFRGPDLIAQEDLEELNIYFYPFKSQKLAIQSDPSVAPSAAILDVPRGKPTSLPIAYATGGLIEVDTVKSDASWREVGGVTGRFEVKFEGAPPISSSFEVVECKPICNE